jgi:hypothetical protein
LDVQTIVPFHGGRTAEVAELAKSAGKSAATKYRGEWGVEDQIFRDGEFTMGRRFDTRALALQWAEEERKFQGNE